MHRVRTNYHRRKSPIFHAVFMEVQAITFNRSTRANDRNDALIPRRRRPRRNFVEDRVWHHCCQRRDEWKRKKAQREKERQSTVVRGASIELAWEGGQTTDRSRRSFLVKRVYRAPGTGSPFKWSLLDDLFSSAEQRDRRDRRRLSRNRRDRWKRARRGVGCGARILWI